MILVLEGTNGTGKSTYAKRLSEELGATIIRPFRPHSDFHFDGTTRLERDLKHYGVPVNTHVDDLYVADILGRLEGSNNVRSILDRSMPSALAYGSARVQLLAAQRDELGLMNLWQSSLRGASVLYVWLHADEEDCKKRMGARNIPLPYSILRARFDQLYGMITFPKMDINTSVRSVEEGIQLILKRALGKAR